MGVTLCHVPIIGSKDLNLFLVLLWAFNIVQVKLFNRLLTRYYVVACVLVCLLTVRSSNGWESVCVGLFLQVCSPRKTNKSCVLWVPLSLSQYIDTQISCVFEKKWLVV